MPQIDDYKCNKCDFLLSRGWGFYVYVTDDKGVRIPCFHPGEDQDIKRVLGKDYSGKAVKERVGKNSLCICLDCLEKDFGLDLEKGDNRICPNCGRMNVKTVDEMEGVQCPKCKKGKIVILDTGVIS